METNQPFSDPLSDSEKRNIMRDFIGKTIESINQEVLSAIAESDERIGIIIAVSYIENMIEDILKKRFVQERSNQFDLFKNGPLETLSGKLKVAHLIGIFNKNTYQLLVKVKSLRNDCAHQINLDFDKGKSQGDKLQEITTIMQGNIFYSTFMETLILIKSVDNKEFIVVKNGETVPIQEHKLILVFLCILFMLQIILDNVETIKNVSGWNLIVE